VRSADNAAVRTWKAYAVCIAVSVVVSLVLMMNTCAVLENATSLYAKRAPLITPVPWMTVILFAVRATMMMTMTMMMYAHNAML
jgi:hypothetical protein